MFIEWLEILNSPHQNYSMEKLQFITKPIFGEKEKNHHDQDYEAIFRSIGVILYTLLSGLSPFLDETEEQTCANILRIDFNFPESQFPYAFQSAKELIERIFLREPK